jgi:hypothetical protein
MNYYYYVSSTKTQFHVQQYKKQLEETGFQDLTIVSQDKVEFGALKAILAAESISLKEKLSCSSAVLYLPTQSQVIKSILEVIYYGETRVSEDDIKSFKKMAQELDMKVQVKKDHTSESEQGENSGGSSPGLIGGLEGFGRVGTSSSHTSSPSPPKLLTCPYCRVGFISSRHYQRHLRRKQLDWEGLESNIMKLIEKTEEGWTCIVCQHSHRFKSRVIEHAEKHVKAGSPDLYYLSCQVLENY